MQDEKSFGNLTIWQWYMLKWSDWMKPPPVFCVWSTKCYAYSKLFLLTLCPMHCVILRKCAYLPVFYSRFNVLFIFLSHCKDSISVPFQTNTFRSFTQRRNLYLEEQRKVGVHVFRNHISCRPEPHNKVRLLRLFRLLSHFFASKNLLIDVCLKKLSVNYFFCMKNMTFHIIPAFCFSLTAWGMRKELK